jgi:sRNA-binding regulator protein Hfq
VIPCLSSAKTIINIEIINGIKLKGTIIESEQEVALWVNNIPTKYRYVAIIKVENGDVLAYVHANSPEKAIECVEAIKAAYKIGNRKISKENIIEII